MIATFAIRTFDCFVITLATLPGLLAVAWLPVTVANLFLAITYWHLALFTHRKFPVVTPGIKRGRGHCQLNPALVDWVTKIRVLMIFHVYSLGVLVSFTAVSWDVMLRSPE